MKRTLLVVPLLVLCSSALAFGDIEHHTYNIDNEGGNGGNSKAYSDSYSHADAYQSQGQFGITEGVNEQSQSAIGSGNMTTYSSTYKAAANPPGVGVGDPTAPCIVTQGVSGGGVIGGGSVSWGRKDEVCSLLELYRLGIGNPNLRAQAEQAYQAAWDIGMRKTLKKAEKVARVEARRTEEETK